jgi:hypothetical protein
MKSLDISVDLILGFDSSLQQKGVPGILLGIKGLPAHKDDSLTAICESIV